MYHDHAAEIAKGQRFDFGANWLQFLDVLDESRIDRAMVSLKAMLRSTDLTGKSFLDAGSGSGLFSLAARKLGASVHSFDYDPQSVACTVELKRRYFPDDANWKVEEGSVLDRAYLSRLGQFDVVYSWGVLHHTGAMWEALDNVAPLVGQGGQLFIAIYNDQGFKSRYWHMVKKTYAKQPLLRWPIVIVHLPYPFLPSLVFRLISGRVKEERGMSFWHDIVDWVGGFPFEVATPGAIVDFYRARGFRLDKLRTTNRSGCNQFVLVKALQA
ncbi:MAG: class I SAM-dependent methyltransferase [Betaproteobacteria bacterium]|nr:class I SAM-dependent methyltransferase [Betaproteobacteria bacterium]